jgi:hypothetical protein
LTAQTVEGLQKQLAKSEEARKDLEHQNSIYKAQHDGEPEPTREGPKCAGCSEITEIRRDTRVSYCVNKKCKVGKQNV